MYSGFVLNEVIPCSAKRIIFFIEYLVAPLCRSRDVYSIPICEKPIHLISPLKNKSVSLKLRNTSTVFLSINRKSAVPGSISISDRLLITS